MNVKGEIMTVSMRMTAASGVFRICQRGVMASASEPKKFFWGEAPERIPKKLKIVQYCCFRAVFSISKYTVR